MSFWSQLGATDTARLNAFRSSMRRDLPQIDLRQGQFSDSFSGRRVDRIAKRRDVGRYPGLADAARRRVAFDDMYIGLERRLVNPRYRVVEEVGLIDYAIGRVNFTAARDTGSEDCGALELRGHELPINNLAGVHRHVNARDPYLSLVTDLYLHHPAAT